MIKLYQTKKLDGYLSQYFYQGCQDLTKKKVDPIFSWFADVFYVNRKKNIIITNESSKFSFLILNYKTREHWNFAGSFCEYLDYAMRVNNLDPYPYLTAFESFGICYKSNKSALAHISRFKIDLVPLMKGNYHNLHPSEKLGYYNQIINTYNTSFKGKKGYHQPVDVWREELLRMELL